MKKLTRIHRVIIVGGLCGVITFLLIFGYKILDFTYVEWLYNKGDLTQHFIGWQFFRNSQWYFPFGLMDNVIYPDKASLIYMDTIPLMGFIFKILSPILPARFQYLGLWGVLCCTLQGIASACILQRYIRKWIPLIFGIMMLTFSPWMIWRFYVHTALGSHWIILFSILLCIYGKELSTGKHTAYWSLLFVLASLIHLYFIPICVVFLGFVTVYRMVLKRSNKTDMMLQLLVSLVPIISALFVLWMAGAFYGTITYSRMVPLGEASANLNFLFDSQGDSAFFTGRANSCIKWKKEGFGYLGLGGFFLVLVAICMFLCSKNTWQWMKKHLLEVGLTVFLLFVFTWMATAPTVIWDNHVLFDWIVPGPVYKLLMVFYSVARYIWPVCYIIMLTAIIAVGRCKDQKFCVILPGLVLGLSFCFQVADLKPFIDSKGSYANSIHPFETLDTELWDSFSGQYKHLYVFSLDNWEELGVYAADRRLTISETSLSRKDDWSIIDRNMKTSQDHMKGIADPDTIYILPNFIEQHILYSLPKLNIYSINGMYVATVNPLPVDSQYVLKLSQD